MRPFYLLMILFFIWTGCGNEPQPQETKSQNPATEIGEKDTSNHLNAIDSTNRIPRLTSENAVEFLSNYFENNPERRVKLETPFGDIKIRLFEKTPIHSANFLMLTKRGYLDDTEFTRVVKNFIVQGGNSQNEQKGLERILIGSYRLEPENVDEYLHKKGAVAIARDYENNPNKLSSPFNFYIVHGRTFNEPQLMAMERDNKIEIPAWKRQIYTTLGGAPHLDGEHTVFGEVYEGMDVVDKLANVPTDASEWPVEKLTIHAEVIKD